MRDFKQLENGDIDLTGSDISLAESTRQNQRDIVLTQKGLLKHAPDRGVSPQRFLNDESPEDFMRETRRQIMKDGARIISLGINTDGIVQINAEYK